MDVVTFVAAWITLLVATTFGAHLASLGGVAPTSAPDVVKELKLDLRVVWLIEISKEF